MGQSDGQMKSDDGDITEPEKRTAVGVGRQSRCISRLPACIFVVVKVTRWGGRGDCLGQMKEWSQGVSPRAIVWKGGNAYSQADSWLCANTRASGALNQTQYQQGLN